MIHHFDFYGLMIEAKSDSAELMEEVRRHFAYFSVANGKAQVRVEIRVEAPPYRGLPALTASVFTPRNVSFIDNRTTYIDYFGQALAVFERDEKRCIIYGTSNDLLHEIAYLFILSTVGQHLDSRGLHRVHALGVSYRNKGILLLLPSGGGKSTMALELMRRPGFLLLGEDTPLIDRRGSILPFPLRLGVRPDHETGIPSQYVRTIQRMEFDPKTLIDIDYFKERLGGPVDPALVLIGQRNLGDVSQIVPLARFRAFQGFLKYVIVGLGVYQGLEFLLERGAWELFGQSGVVASRCYNSIQVLYRAPAYRFVLGRDTEKNCQTLIEFIESAIPPGDGVATADSSVRCTSR